MGEPGTNSSGSGGTTGEGATGGTSTPKYSTDSLDPAIVAQMTADELKKFIDTGRTGRRNALPDVTDPDAGSTSTAGVAEAMESCSLQSDKGQSNSGSGS